MVLCKLKYDNDSGYIGAVCVLVSMMRCVRSDCVPLKGHSVAAPGFDLRGGVDFVNGEGVRKSLKL